MINQSVDTKLYQEIDNEIKNLLDDLIDEELEAGGPTNHRDTRASK